ncbi:MAG: hypothetical protein GC205_01510 [Bacteroidetes bacterium]|nr:hypothetical protein [Bacteroidota bacterium]
MEGDRIVVRDVPGRHISRLGASLMTRVPVDQAVERIFARTNMDPANRHPAEPVAFEGWHHPQ